MPSAIEIKNVTRREIIDMMDEKDKLEQQLKTLGEVLQSVNIIFIFIVSLLCITSNV